MKHRILGISLLAATALALGLSAPASAGTVTVTYTGFVTTDIVGYSNPGTGDAWVYSTGLNIGSTISETYTVNTNTAGASSGSGSGYSYVSGGGAFGSTSPVSAVVQFNNSTIDVTGNFYGLEYQSTLGASLNAFPCQQACGSNEINSEAEASTYDPLTGGTVVEADAYIYNYSGSSFVTTNLGAPLNYSLSGGDTGVGVYEYEFESAPGTPYQGLSEQIGFRPFNVTVTPDVPEPATWAMMLIGFAGVGFVARRPSRRFAPQGEARS